MLPNPANYKECLKYLKLLGNADATHYFIKTLIADTEARNKELLGYIAQKECDVCKLEKKIEQCNDEIQAAIGNIKYTEKLIRANQEFLYCTIRTCCIHESLWAGISESDSVVSAAGSLFQNSS
jgi:hypothetical protein